jgi:hypothetical protein
LANIVGVVSKAITVPETILSSSTAGNSYFTEHTKRFYQTILFVYFESEIQGRRPGFILFGPDLALLVLEVRIIQEIPCFKLTVMNSIL